MQLTWRRLGAEAEFSGRQLAIQRIAAVVFVDDEEVVAVHRRRRDILAGVQDAPTWTARLRPNVTRRSSRNQGKLHGEPGRS